MDPKVNYFIVGLFVVVLSALTILFSLWMVLGFNQQTYSDYLIYVTESVSGLNVEAPVKFNGVEVGTVKHISLTPNNPGQVTVEIAVQTGTPISVDTRATMMSQGITGLTFINLKGGNAQSALLKAKSGQLPVIVSAPSLLVRLDTTINNLSLALLEIDRSLIQVLGKENQQNFSKILRSLATVTSGMAAHQNDINASLMATPIAMNNMSQASISITRTLTDLNSQLSQGLLPNLTQLTTELQTDPAMLIRGRQNPVLGPGES